MILKIFKILKHRTDQMICLSVRLCYCKMMDNSFRHVICMCLMSSTCLVSDMRTHIHPAHIHPVLCVMIQFKIVISNTQKTTLIDFLLCRCCRCCRYDMRLVKQQTVTNVNTYTSVQHSQSLSTTESE